MVKRESGRSRLATILLSFVLFFGASFLTSHLDVTQVYAATEVSSWEQLKTAVGNGDTEIEIKSSFPYDGTSIVIPEGANINLTGTGTIYSSEKKEYDSMFKVKGSLTIGSNVTLSGKIGDGTQCPDRTSETPTYTEDKFSGGYTDGAKTYTPKGFFIDVEAGGTATLNGTISDFITSGNKETTPRYVAPVVANGSYATFNLGASGTIKNNVVGYIVNEDKAYTNAQEIKQYVKGAAPNSLRKPSAYDQKQDREKYERVREKDAGIDGGSPGSGITATAGAVIYKDGAKGNIEGTIDNNRGDTGGVMASGENTEVHIKGNTVISRNVGVQFGGGSTTEQGAVLAMHSGTMKQNVAWFGGGAVFSTQNGVDWLLGYMVDDNGKPEFDARKDGKFAMAGGELTENTAFTRGGAILVDSNGVAVKAGKLTNNMSWMLGGAVYVMGDHPKYTYTMHIDPVYVHDNLAVSGKDQARENAATDTYSKEQLDEKNSLLQRKLTKVGNSCADPGTGDLFDGTIGDNTDDSVDGKGNDGTGGGVWLCPYGSVIFDAARTDAVVIDSNYATGTVGGGNADSKYNSKKSTSSRSGISAGSDLHTDQGKQDGGVTITGLTDGGWFNENTNQPYTTETSSNRTNLVSTREIVSGDVPKKYQEDEYVLVTGNVARRGGGLASDGKFYFGPLKSTADLNAKMTVSKVWTPSADTEPIAIRVIAKQGASEVVVADVPLDGIENPPSSEFDTVSELAPDGNTWTGEFALPYVVTAANGSNITNIKLFSLFHDGNEIDLTKVTGREKLGDLLKKNKQGEVEVRAAQGVTLIFKEMNVEKDSEGHWVATNEEHSTHVFTPNNIDFASLKLTREKAEETMEDVIDPDTGQITQKTSFGTYTAGLALQLETGNDNEAIIEKYVNKDVHSDIVNFDQDFTYDIMGYVPIMAKEFTVSDTLVPGLEFANKDGNAVADKSTIEKISVKTINDHKPDGTVSQAGMPDSEGKEIDLTSGNADIQINGNKLVVKIDENTYYKNKNNVDKNALAELRGRWVQVTFHARIKDEYRNIDALKALTYGGNKNSWLNDEDNKYSDQRHEATFANGDLVLADALFKQFSMGPDPIIWAVEAPSRLFAKTASGDYYATPMNDKSGNTWSKLEDGSADWRNANNRYNGTPPEANNTRWTLDTEGDDAGLVAALKKMPLIKGAQLGKGAEGQERIFIEVYNPKAVSDGNTSGYEIYATTSDDHKSGRLWEKLEPGSTAYNNGKERLKNDRYTLRMLDFVSESVILSEGGKNWPVITQQTHEGMSNQSSYDVKFGNDSEASYRSNIVTVEPETTEIDVAKKWAPDNKWPAGVDSVTLTVYALNKQNDEKTVYVDKDGKVVGIFAEGDSNIPAGAKPLTVELKPDDPATDEVDESKATIKDLPLLKNTVYTARETKINDKEIVYKDNGVATTSIGDSKIVTTNTAGYKGDGKKFESLRDSKGVKVVRGAIADNRLWAIALNGNYYVTEVNDTDGSGEWKKLDKPAEDANPESDAVKIYDRAQKLLGMIDSQGRFTAVKDEELDNDKIEDLDQPIGTPTETKVFDIIPSVTATNSTSSIEKYVNDDVHSDLGEFDKAFKYDILVYVPAGSTELTITDPLKTGVLEFAKKKDSLDAAKQTSAEKAETADDTIAAVIAKAKNDHTADSTVAGKDSDNEGANIASKISSKSIDGNKLTIKFEGKADTENEGNKLPLDFAGKWVQVTFWAKYTDEIIRAADAGDFKKIRENGAVISEEYQNVAQDAAEDEFSHEGTVNKASANISVGNDFNFDLASNEVTVKPDTEKLWVQKKWQNEEGEELSKWPKGMTVKINVYKNATGSEAEVVETLEVSSFEPVSSKTYPKLVGVTYSVDEVEVPEKYAKLDEITGDGSEEKPFVITNAARKYTGAEITKKWVGVTMDEIPSGEDFKTYLVLKDGEGKDVSEEYADKLTVTVKGSTYKAKWVGLPDGKYTVEEKAIPGFDTEVNGSTITNKKKPSGEKPEIEKYVNQAVHKDITLDEVFTYDIIAYVTKDADSVTITDKLHDMLTFDGDASHVAVVDLGEADNHLVTNNIAGVEVNKNASVAQKGKPVEGAKVEINGQTLKVFITNKLKKTTAKGEDVYTPVEIESVNPKEKGYYELIEDEYVLTEDTAPAVDKTYYVMETPEESDSQPSFSAVTIETVNPSEKGYYEYSSYEYVPTKDERPDPDTTYYVKAEGQVEEADGYEYDGENQPVTALRGHWVKVTFNAKINGKTLEEVKKKYENIKASDVDDSRDPENIGNAPVISVEDHTGLPNDASYTIGVANEAGIQEDVHKDKSNIVTVKPKEKKEDKPGTDGEDNTGTDGEDNSGKSDKGTDGEDDRPDADLGTKKPAQNSAGKKSAATGDDVQLGVAIPGLMCAIAVLEILRRRRKAK